MTLAVSGPHVYSVLAPTRDLLIGSATRDGETFEISRLPPAADNQSDD